MSESSSSVWKFLKKANDDQQFNALQHVLYTLIFVSVLLIDRKPVFRFFSVFYRRFSVSVFFKNRLSLLHCKLLFLHCPNLGYSRFVLLCSKIMQNLAVLHARIYIVFKLFKVIEQKLWFAPLKAIVSWNNLVKAI